MAWTVELPAVLLKDLQENILSDTQDKLPITSIEKKHNQPEYPQGPSHSGKDDTHSDTRKHSLS